MGENMLHVTMSFPKQKLAEEEVGRYFTAGNITHLHKLLGIPMQASILYENGLRK